MLNLWDDFLKVVEFIKQTLQDIYRDLGVNYNAKANEITEWYHVEEKKPRGKDGKQIACYAIVKAKYTVPHKNK